MVTLTEVKSDLDWQTLESGESGTFRARLPDGGWLVQSYKGGLCYVPPMAWPNSWKVTTRTTTVTFSEGDNSDRSETVSEKVLT